MNDSRFFILVALIFANLAATGAVLVDTAPTEASAYIALSMGTVGLFGSVYSIYRFMKSETGLSKEVQA